MGAEDEMLERLAAFDRFLDDPSGEVDADEAVGMLGRQVGTRDDRNGTRSDRVGGRDDRNGSSGPAGEARPPQAGPSRGHDTAAVSSVATLVALPGLHELRRNPIVGALLLVAGVWAPIVALIGMWIIRDRPSQWLLDPTALRAMIAVGATAIISRVVAVWLAARRCEPAAGSRLRLYGFAAVAILAVPVTYVSMRFEQAKNVVDEVFSGSNGDAPVALSADDLAAQNFRTVLLLGGDEGPGRFGLRTDTMILVMVHHESGRMAMVSVPRNLANVQFPPGSAMAEAYPDGFDDLANAIFPAVYSDSDLTEAYTRDGLEPGALVLMEGLSYTLGITIDDYALVNMVGFIDVIDSLGGVEINLDMEIPMPGNPPGAKHQVPPSIGPGLVDMDGTVALGYVRSRDADSDYQRMERQRLLLTAVASQAGIGDVLTNFGELSSALRGTIRTSMSVDEAKGLLGALEEAGTNIQSVGLVPPLVDPGDPDFDEFAEVIDIVRLALTDNALVDGLLEPLLPDTVPPTEP